MNLYRQPWESIPSHVERVLLDDLFEGASTSEIASFCGCKAALVDRVRGARRVFEHAELIRDRIDWPFDAAALIHMALEQYAERVIQDSKGRNRGAHKNSGPRQSEHRESGASNPGSAGMGSVAAGFMEPTRGACASVFGRRHSSERRSTPQTK